MAHPSLASAGSVYVVSVNDAFVMKAWKDALVAGSVSGSKIHFLADPSAAFTNAVQMAFDDAKAIFGGERSKRYAIVVEEGKVQSVHVEPDNTGVDGRLSSLVELLSLR
jgi:2-Cys peroxiredoxin 5